MSINPKLPDSSSIPVPAPIQSARSGLPAAQLPEIPVQSINLDDFAAEALIAVENDAALEEGVFQRLSNYLESHCDLRPLTQMASENIEYFAEQRDKVFSSDTGKLLFNEVKWNEKIEKLASELSRNSHNRVEKIQKLIKKFEASLSPDLQNKIKKGSTEQEIIEFQENIISYASFGVSAGKLFNFLNAEEVRQLNLNLNVGKTVTTWITIGHLADTISIKSKTIKELKKKIENNLVQLERTQFPQQKKDLELEIDQLHRRVLQLEAEKVDAIEEMTTSVLNTVSATLEGQESIFTKEMITQLVDGCSQAIKDAAPVAISGAAVAGSAVSLGISLYKTAKASKQLIDLKANREILEKRILDEKDPIKSIILAAKLDTFATLEHEMGANIALKVISSTAGGLAVCSAVHTAIVTAGVVLSVAAEVSLAATGVGALALAGIGAAGGVVFTAYQNRFEIMNFIMTADVSPRLLCSQYELQKEIELYIKARDIFSNLSEENQELHLMHGLAYKLKLDMDELKGGGAIKKQALATRQFLDLGSKIKENELLMQTTRKSVEVGSGKIKSIQKDMRVLKNRREIEDLKLEWNKFQSRFSKYDITTLLAVKSCLNAALVEESGRSSVTDLLKENNFSYEEPITMEQVFAFITERQNLA